MFQQMGYKIDESQALTVDREEIPDFHVMPDEETSGEHYSELTTLKQNQCCLNAEIA